MSLRDRSGKCSKRRKSSVSHAKSNETLYSYCSEEPRNTGGEFDDELCYKDRQCAACFIVVEEKTRPILSQQTSELLAILKIEINSVSEENLLREFEGIFVGVRKLVDFQAKFHVDELLQLIA